MNTCGTHTVCDQSKVRPASAGGRRIADPGHLWRARRGFAVLGGLALAVSMMAFGPSALANGYGESSPWQFQSPGELIARNAVLDTWARYKARGYGPASTTINNNTTIGKQYNCVVSATSYGNWATNSTVANSPSATGASALAQGNSANTKTEVWTPSGGVGSIGTNQDNSGAVGATVNGSTTVKNYGNAQQALNNTQTNSGTQNATVNGSTACSGPLN